MTPTPPSPSATPASIAREAGPVAALYRDPDTGFTSLRVNEQRLESQGRPVDFLLRGICRYEPDRDQWRRVPWHILGLPIRLVPRASVEDRRQQTVLVRLPEEVPLLWVRCTEGAAPGPAPSVPAMREALATSGRVLCNDVDLPPPPSGRAAACVQVRDRRFPCEIWYPAASSHAGQATAPETQHVFSVPGDDTPRSQLAVRDAAAHPGTYPLIVFGRVRRRRPSSSPPPPSPPPRRTRRTSAPPPSRARPPPPRPLCPGPPARG